MKRTCTLAVPMTELELAWVYLCASTLGTSANEYVRQNLAGDNDVDDPKAIVEMASTIHPASNRVANTLQAAIRHAKKAMENE